MEGSFVSGFLAGQASFLCMLFILVKYFLFRSGPETRREKYRSRNGKKPQVIHVSYRVLVVLVCVWTFVIICH